MVRDIVTGNFAIKNKTMGNMSFVDYINENYSDRKTSWHV